MAQPIEETTDKEGFVDELKPGTKLMHGQYTIESFLNAGGFGITYLARDSLDRKVVIKECFPGAFCRRSRYIVQARSRAHQNELKSIVRLFVQEARSLAKLDHPNIVGVHQVFEDNDTAYMALDFVEGRDLLDTIEDPNHGLSPAQIKAILKEVLGAVGFIHDQGMLHRDISPDNILINKKFHPVLIDFGAAREEATKQSRVLSALRVVKDGYSPQEFYIAGSEQSPSSDLYALAATFHHLIAGDVPPNSQARLAAIASGEKDPYTPIVGKYPDYDDNFLSALDKALAVLPKDRVQSAKEWIQMMDGLHSNVTPLNVSSSAAAKPAAASKGETKSKMPILLGSAAAIALLVGVGVMTMGGGEDIPVAQAPTVEAPAAVAETAVAAVPAQEPVVAAAPEPVQAVVEEAPAAIEVPEVVEEPSVVAALEEAITDPAPATAEVPAAPEAPVVAEEPAVIVEAAPAPLPVAEATPEITAEPAAPAAQTASDASVAVSGPEIADAPTPAIRPEARPEAVSLAAVPTQVPLPAPVVTPPMLVDTPTTGAAFPEQITSLPTVDQASAQLALPGTPEQVSAIGDGPVVDIVAVTPGNEIIEEEPASGIISSWGVRLPFTATGPNSNIIAEAGAVAPVWVKPGLLITAVNGTQIDAISDIPGVLRELNPEDAQSPTIAVTFGTSDPSSGRQSDEIWFLPVVQQVELSDGTRFESAFAGSGWQTSVVILAASQSGGLQVGDMITSYIPTSEPVDGRNTLFDIFSRESEKGADQFLFAVQRNGSLWVASVANPGAAE